jgi:glucose-6-phosphate isomerase
VFEFGIESDRYFKFWDWVGGRYSVCSSAGLVPLSLAYSFGLMDKFLAGARSMDRHFFGAPLHSNLPVLLGLLGVWNLSFMGYKVLGLVRNYVEIGMITERIKIPCIDEDDAAVQRGVVQVPGARPAG